VPELVDGGTTAFIGSIVIDDDKAAYGYILVEVFEANSRGRVPVCVKPKERDRAQSWCVTRERVLEPPHVIGKVARIVLELSLQEFSIAVQGSWTTLMIVETDKGYQASLCGSLRPGSRFANRTGAIYPLVRFTDVLKRVEEVN
jgi:hypothetical protein